MSRRGLAALLAVALMAPLLPAYPARAQLSPGPLSSAHQDYDKPTECFECHTRGGGKPQDQRCLDCHTEIAALQGSGRGFHAREGKADCATCHPEHGGRGFQLIQWETSEKDFDHARTGWPLQGKHGQTECRKCHQPKNQKWPGAAKIRVKDRSRTWLGLETACASCHADPHRGQLAADCASCHDQRAFKPVPGFDHAKSAYPLTGKHADVACAKCHLAPAVATTRDEKGQPVPQWKPLPHADCVACHKDPHAGRLPGACASCHKTEGFALVDKNAFDHSRTRYPLAGKHAAVACAKCHDPKTAWGPKPAFATCGACHKDAHAGQATLAGKPADCAACHTVAGFKPSSYTVARHAQTPYPLEGAHAAVPCAKCHARDESATAATRLGPARVPMRPGHAACTDCHRDPHAGRFAAGGARPRAEGCLACHSMARFRPARFESADHTAAKAGFALSGAHLAVPCVACHAELKGTPATASLLTAPPGRALPFAEAPTTCRGCHPGPHGEQFAARKDGGACEVCHDDRAWAPAARFDHDRMSAFKLEGAHARTRCSSCHPTAADTQGKPQVVYRPLSGRCESCHVEGGSAAPLPRSVPVRPRPAGAAAGAQEIRHASFR